MSNKIDNTFGAGSTQFENREGKVRERTPGGKSFGEFLSVDERDDDVNSQSRPDEEQGFAGPRGADVFGSIIGNIGDTRERERDDNVNRGRTSFRPEDKAEFDDDNAKKKQKVKPRLGVGKEEGQEFDKREERFIEKTEQPQFAAFQVPQMVERAFAPAPVEKTTPQIPVKMIDQIVQEVRLGINASGAAEFQFDLKSDVLEGLKLKISTKDGQVTASFIAENIHIKEQIDQGVQELVKALQERGLEVASMNVMVGADTSGSGGQGQQQQDNRQGGYYQAEGGVQQGSTSDTAQQESVRSNTDYTI